LLKEKKNMKYEYKFEMIAMKGGIASLKPKEEYHDIIAQAAEDGWRLVQIFAPATQGHGAAGYFELIFERPVD
jgi:hypothetical protein